MKKLIEIYYWFYILIPGATILKLNEILVVLIIAFISYNIKKKSLSVFLLIISLILLLLTKRIMFLLIIINEIIIWFYYDKNK